MSKIENKKQTAARATGARTHTNTTVAANAIRTSTNGWQYYAWHQRFLCILDVCSIDLFYSQCCRRASTARTMYPWTPLATNHCHWSTLIRLNDITRVQTSRVRCSHCHSHLFRSNQLCWSALQRFCGVTPRRCLVAALLSADCRSVLIRLCEHILQIWENKLEK